MADLVPRHQIAEVTELLGAPFLNTFGATETGIPPGNGSTIPIGVVPESLAKRQCSFCEVRLVDAEGNDVADGAPGELLMRGPTLFSGYWNADDTNARDFRDGWFHMGDVFRRTADGGLDFVDRVKYLIKSGGENIYPAEIEQAIMADARVADAVVVRKADARWGEVPVAFVARRDDSLDEAAIRARCRQALAGYKQPKEIRFIALEDLPRSTSGKIQRQALEALLAAEA
jgi:fatty-acyl-CoA synthase